MLLTGLIHPEILSALGSAGHNSVVLIADGNFPASTKIGPNAKLVHLNLSPGVVNATEVLKALVSVCPFEKAKVMAYAVDGPYAQAQEPPIWAKFRENLPGIDLEPVEQSVFYELSRSPDVILSIQTAEQGLFANLLLTIGVRRS